MLHPGAGVESVDCEKRGGGPQESQAAIPREMVTRCRATEPLMSVLDFKEKMSP